jgi:Immunoglobulin domain
MSFNFMPEDPATVNLSGTFETGVGSGLSIGFSIYQNPYAVLRVNGQEIARKSALSVYNVGSVTAMPWVEVVMSPDRKVTVWFNGSVVFDAVQTTLDPAAGWRFGWGARCGGQYARYSIDEISLHTFLERVRDRSDVLQASDPISSLLGNSPSGEGVANAIDGTQQKFVIFGTGGMGFTVTPALGATVVTAIAITSANDFPQRDPGAYEVLGSNDGTTFESIATSPINPDERRHFRRVFEFNNTRAYTTYRVRFPRPQVAFDHMQVSEVELLGRAVLTVPLSGITDGDDGQQMLTVTATSQTPTVMAAPSVNYQTPQSTGRLVFGDAPAGANGTTAITVRVQDDGGTANSGVNVFERSFNLTVNPINQQPTLAPIPTVAVDTTTAATVEVPLSFITAGGDALSRTVAVTAQSVADSAKPLTVTPTVTYTSPETTGKVSFSLAQNASGVATVTVTVQDTAGTANGGVDTLTRSFVVKAGPQPPVIEVAPVNQVAQPGDTVTFSVQASGIGLAYQWSKDGTPIPGATSATLQLPFVSTTAIGIYSVRVSNANLENQNPTAQAFLALWTPPGATDVQLTQQAQFSVPVTLPNGFSVTRQWILNGAEINGSTQENLTIGTATRDSVGGYAARVVVTSPTLGSVTLTSPVAPLRLISDLTTLYSTGLNTNGLRLTDRATDPHYTLIDPSPITGPAVAVVTSGTFPTPPWTAGGTASAWISPSARLRELGTTAGTEYIYRTTFDLNGIDLNTVRIQGKVAADDTVTAIRLNGTALTTPASVGFDGYKTFDFTPGSTRYGDRFPERGFLGTGRHVAVTGDTSGATGEDGEPLPLGAGVHGAVGSVWWTWRAPSNCRVTVTTEGSGIPTILSVFEGVALERLRHLGSADGAGATAATVRSVTFTAVSGRDYPIRLDGYQAAEGAVGVVVRAETLDANGQVTGTVPTLVTLPSGLLPGENTLDFVVRNTPDSGLDRSLTGLRVEFTSVQGVPRPVMLIASPSGGVETYGNRKSFVAQVVSGTPVTYEWYRDGQRIEGADESVLTFNRVEEEDAGRYSVRIQNLNGSIWTTPVPFEVDVPLTITAQPTDQNVRVGGTTQFGIRFRGNPPLSVQWYRNGEAISGGNGTNLTLSAVTVAQAGRYHAVVSDRDDFLSSAEAVLNVLETPQIVQEPLDFSGISGVDSLRLQTIVDGSTPLRYLWFRNDVPLAVDNAPVLDLGLLRPSHAGEYHLMATNPVGVVISRKATVTVHEPPTVVSGSGNVKVFEGEKATFSVNASGSGDLEYTWYVGGTIVPNAKGNSLDLDGLTRGQSGKVSVVVRSPYGEVTNDYTLEVFQAPVPVVSTGINRTQVFVLKPGWNALFLEVQPEQNDVPTVFKDVPFTSLWRWSDPRTGPQFIADQSEAKLDVARWQIHLPTSRPESFQNNLAAVFRHEAYLLNLSGTQDVTLTITGKPGYQRSRWAVDGYTLTGLPIDPDWPNGGPSVLDFLSPSTAHFDAATSQPRGIYRLQSNGSWVALTASDTLKSGVAYWIYTKGGSDYLAPVEAEIPGLTEITYTLGGDQKEMAFNFRTTTSGAAIQNVFLSHWLPDQSLPLRISEFAPQEGSSWRDLPNGYSVSPTQGTRRTIRLAASRDRVPGLLYEGILTLKAGGVRHVVPLTIERDKPDTVAQASRPFNPVGLWMGTVRITHVSEVNGLKTNYTVVYDTNRVDGVETVVSRATTEVRNVEQGSRPTPVKEPFDMRLILHTGVDGVSRILQSVTLLKKADSVTVANQVVTAQQGGDAVLISDPSLLGSFEGVTLRGRDKVGGRFSTPFYPMYQTNGIPFDAGLDLGRRIQASWSLPPGAPLNPYRHKFHPDHDNLDRSFQTYKAEAYPVRRTVVLDIPARQGSTRKPGAGQDEIEGVYTEVIEGIHRIPITVQGTVSLKRLIAVGVLNPTP